MKKYNAQAEAKHQFWELEWKCMVFWLSRVRPVWLNHKDPEKMEARIIY